MQLSVRTYVDIHRAGYDRPYTERRDITGQDTVKDLLLLKAALLADKNDDAVRRYNIFNQSVVTLADGEVLRGEMRLVQTVIFGDVRPIPNQPYPSTLAEVATPLQAKGLSDAFQLSNAQKAHGIYQRMLAQGYTHLVTGAVGEIVWLNPNEGKVLVYGRDGRRQWPALPQVPATPSPPKL